MGRNKVNGHSGSRRKKEKQKSDEEEEQQTKNRNGTEKRMLMMTKIRMEKIRQGRINEKWRIIVSGMPIPKNEIEKGLMMPRMMMVSHIDNGNEK